MALLGAVLHFGYSDMQNMECSEFVDFIEIVNSTLLQSNQ